MTYSRQNSLGRGGLKLATLLALATASFSSSSFAAIPPAPSAAECPLIGTMTVIAPRLPQRAVVVADLGTMTVSATREVVIANNPARATPRAF